MPAFTDEEMTWLHRKWAIIRRSQTQADRAVNDWRKLSDEVNDYMDRSGILDPLQRSKVKRENLRLMDLSELGAFYRREASAHCQDVYLFLRLKEMGVL